MELRCYPRVCDERSLMCVRVWTRINQSTSSYRRQRPHGSPLCASSRSRTSEVMWRALPLLVAACALLAPTAADDAEWIEFYDKASNKKAYYHSVTRESKWEAPEGAKIRHMSAEGTASAQRTGKPDQRGTVFFVLMLPIVLVFGGLGLLFHMASKEGLMQALKERAKKQRDRGQARA